MGSRARVVSLEGPVTAVTMLAEYRLLCVLTETLLKEKEEWGGVGGSQEREEIQASAPNPTTSEVPGPSHATKCCWHGCPQGKKSDEMGGNCAAWRVRARGLHMGQCCTHIREGTNN